MLRKPLPLLVLLSFLLALPATAASEAEQVNMLRKLFRAEPGEWLKMLEEHRSLLDQSFFERCERRIEWGLDNNHFEDAFRFSLVADLAAQVTKREQRYRLELAGLLLKSNNVPLALDILENIRIAPHSESDPTYLEATFLLASIYFEQKNWPGAYALYEEAAAGGHRKAECLERMGQVNLVAGNEELARSQFQEALRLDPKREVARKELDDMNSGTFAPIEPGPGAGPLDPAVAQRAQAAFQEAEAFYQQRNFEMAEESYLKAIQADPNHAGAHKYLGALYYRLRSVDQAIRHLERAAELVAEDFEAWRFLGNALERRFDTQGQADDLQKAIESYEKARALKPADPLLLSELERAREKLQMLTAPAGTQHTQEMYQ